MVSLIQTVDTAHEDMIHDAEMDYYGTRVATCSSDRSVKIFDVRNGTQKLIADLREHEGPVWQVAWAHPMFGNILASCSYDRKVILWKETDGIWKKIYEYGNHDSSVNSICWAPHEFGLMLTCGSSDGAVSVISSSGDGNWETKKINNAHTIGCNAVSWAPAVSPGSALEQSNAPRPAPVKRFVTGGCDNLVKIWKYVDDDDKWIEEQKLEAHSDWIRNVAWAPSIGLQRSMIASCSQDRRVMIWTNNGTNNNWTNITLHTFDDVVWQVSWSITGNILAVSAGDNKISLWKESLDGQWVCISDINKGQGEMITSATERTL
ncbi:protein SEC13 homolog [Centruroides sculpturatus]|uniref:protein SEC13 homolog n=1 Tax=Centruroides sculpturatus TaxID=218467 RepID=UPI000C6DC222|nr:protein SEC13 homolog [Centruroides sculpturatus]